MRDTEKEGALSPDQINRDRKSGTKSWGRDVGTPSVKDVQDGVDSCTTLYLEDFSQAQKYISIYSHLQDLVSRSAEPISVLKLCKIHFKIEFSFLCSVSSSLNFYKSIGFPIEGIICN